MRTARELLQTYLDSVRDPSAAASVFAPDGVLELPFLTSLGIPPRAEGREQISALLTGLLAGVPDFAFQPPTVYIDTDTKVYAEYAVSATTVDGRAFEQLYAGLLVAKNDQIVLLREHLDLVKTARALLPGGTADIPA
jgi:uncharacterized protein